MFLKNIIDPSRMHTHMHTRTQTYTRVISSTFENLLISETRGALLAHPLSPPQPSQQSSWPLYLHNGLFCAAAPPPPSDKGHVLTGLLPLTSFLPPAVPRYLPLSLHRRSLRLRSAARALSTLLEGATRSMANVRRETFGDV